LKSIDLNKKESESSLFKELKLNKKKERSRSNNIVLSSLEELKSISKNKREFVLNLNPELRWKEWKEKKELKNLARKPSELKRKEEFNMSPMLLKDKLRWKLFVKNKNSKN